MARRKRMRSIIKYTLVTFIGLWCTALIIPTVLAIMLSLLLGPINIMGVQETFQSVMSSNIAFYVHIILPYCGWLGGLTLVVCLVFSIMLNKDQV